MRAVYGFSSLHLTALFNIISISRFEPLAAEGTFGSFGIGDKTEAQNVSGHRRDGSWLVLAAVLFLASAPFSELAIKCSVIAGA